MKNRDLLSIIKQNWKTAAILAVFAAWVSAGIVTSRVSAASGVPILVRDAVLAAPSGSVNPHGAAQWQLYADGNRELEVEIEDVSLAQGTTLTAVIDGSNVGPIVLDDRGKGRLKLKTENGQTVPTVNAGSPVQVRNGSTVLAAGAFGGSATPTPTSSPTGTPSPSPTGSPNGTPSPSPTATPGNTIVLVRDAVLASPSGSPNPHGAAQWQLSANGGRELEVELEDTNLAQGISLTALIDGASIGTLVVDDRGKAKLKLKSELGQAVPTVNAGSAIQVRNGNTVLAAGTFNVGGTPTPTPSVTPTATPTPNGTPSPSPSPANGDLCAALTGATLNGALPTGYASYENHSSRTELEVRVRQIALPIGTVLAVSVDGFATGNITLQSGGEGRLRLRSDDGQIVPVITPGSTITVKNGDVTILSGAFGGSVGPTPTPTGTPGVTPSPTPSLGRSFEAHLTGVQVTPPVTTNGNGEIKITLNAAETQATVFGEFHNLSSNQIGARIETTVGTVTTIRELGVVGGLNGNFAAVTFDITAAQIQQLRSGLLSAVIMSVNNPSGEIRGRLTQHSNVSDFNGNGLADFAFFRPLSTEWHVSNEDGTSTQTFGSPADQPVSGDYDGDGKTDIAVFSKVGTRAFWNINRSSDGGLTSVRLGYDTDLPVQADFDGDGRLDMAVFRPTFRTWLVLRSDGSGQQVIRLGVPGDKPMPADIDGDGKDDAVVFSPTEGTWSWIRSSDNRRGLLRWGFATDIPVRGDFDGDGKADISLYRPSEGTWYSVRSSDGQIQSTQFGQPNDVPVAGKYDADSKTDIAVFRPSEGKWYVLNSTDGVVRTIQFGGIGDIPLTVR